MRLYNKILIYLDTSYAMVVNYFVSASSRQHITFECRTRSHQLFNLWLDGNDDMAGVSYLPHNPKVSADLYILTSNSSLGDVINEFRTKKLGLEPLNIRSGPGVVDRLKVPWTYCFSPEIVPKPEDWQNHIGACCIL